MLPLNALRWGSEAPQPARRALRAGPLSLSFEEGGLRAIRLGDREVLRRVYVAVRDRAWGTVPLELSDVQLTEGDGGFRLSFQADHRQGEIDFGWRGTITGEADGTIVFAMDGAARSTFLRSRIGFCILHPPEGCAGHSCVVEHDDGSRVTDEFPLQIAPHQPFVEMRSIAHEVAPGLWAEVRFAGDIFEMEDQRNWTDASYKTYCTPLRLPYPVAVAAGERVAQSVTLTLSGGQKGEGGGEQGAGGAVAVAVSDEVVGPLPAIGVGLASHDEPLGEAATARLRALGLAHLRVDLRLADDGWRGTLARATDEARALGAALEVAPTLSDDAEAELAALADAVREAAPPVARWLVYRAGEAVTGERWVALARRILKPLAPDAAVAGGTNAYFTELNRNRPALGPLDLVAYSLNPQVHAFDDASMVETLAMQAATVESARAFVGDRPIAISPITLLPRGNADGTAPRAGSADPPPADPRQASLFAAAWTVGSLAALAGAGVASATYYETTGPRGLLGGADGPLPGDAFPVYHIFAALGALRGGAVLRVATTDPLRATALAVRQDGRTTILLANLLPEAQPITLRVAGARAAVRLLDETTAAGAIADPEGFRVTTPELQPLADGALTLSLLPYAVAEIAVE